MKTLKDIQSTLKSRFRRSKFEWLEQYVVGQAFAPLDYKLGVPTQRDASLDISELESWIHEWKALNIEGIEVIWRTVHWSWLGGERLVPDRISITSIDAFLNLMDPTQETLQLWRRAQGRVARMKSLDLTNAARSMAGLGMSLLDDDDDEFERVIGVGRWLLAHYPANCFVREIPVEGVDTKWLERHRRVVTVIVTNESERFFTAPHLFEAWGFKTVPSTVRVRHAHCFIPEIPPEELVQLPASILSKRKPKAVVIVENLQTGLSIEVPEDVPIFMGLGFGLEALKDVHWLKNVPIFYFGDLDVHGLAILSALRKQFKQAKSFLMDSETFEKWECFAIEDPTRNIPLLLPNLSDSERDLFERLVTNRLRLEQERIPLRVINQTIQSLIAGR